MLAEELRGVGVPTVAVLGNHDYHSDEQDAVAEVLEEAEHPRPGGRGGGGGGTRPPARDRGQQGFGGGFAGACASDFGEPEMKAFVAHTKTLAGRLERALGGLQADRRIALLHYSPVAETLAGSPARSTPSSAATCWPRRSTGPGPTWSCTATPIGAAATGATLGGVPVRNVAAPVIGRAYEVFRFDAEDAPG